jgi:alpha-amylase
MNRRRSPMPFVALLCFFCILASCSIGTQTATQPTTTTVAVVPTLDLPTVAPTITAAPIATPFPLEAGWWDDAVCYEVFVRSFYDSNGDGIGDLRGLTEKLDYISDGDDTTTGDLGVNCIWLMPVADSPSYHGYDVVDYRAIEPDYGTVEDFKAFTAAAHERDIKVIVDLVLNHTSSEHPWFKEARDDPSSPRRDWYLWSNDDPGYFGPWGQTVWHPYQDGYYYGIFVDTMPDLNYRNPDVTQEAYDISRFWVEEMGVDGFRLDAIRHVVEAGQTQQDTLETHAWLREYRRFLDTLDRPVYTVGEVLDSSTDIIGTYYPDQLDMFFEFGVADTLVGAAQSELADFMVNAVNNSTTIIPYQRFAPLLTNHDEDRVMSQLGDDMGKARIAATALLAMPGLPFVYYGEEIGMLGTKPDERIRTPMQWTSDPSGGFTSGTPWEPFQDNYRERNVAAQEGDEASLLNLYRRMIALHRSEPALSRGDFIPLTTSDTSVAAFLRRAGDDAVLVMLNFSANQKEGIQINGEAAGVAAATYQLSSLHGDADAAPLTVGTNGAISDYVPLPTLEAQTGYVLKLGE